MKVIIADDDGVSRAAISGCLREGKYEVVVCKNGIEAMDIIKTGSIRFAVLDWMMPGMDGLALCKEIRKLNLQRYVYIIIITAKNEKKDIVEALDSGADDYLSKPFSKEELLSRMRVGTRILDIHDKLIKSQRKLLNLVREDPVTALPNRRAFLDEAVKDMDRASREKHMISGILIGIDNFNIVSNVHGPAAGDSLLEELAHRLKSVCRLYDKIGRFSGEKFLVILPNTKTHEAVKVAQRMRSVIAEKPYEIMGNRINLSACFGISVLLPENGMRDEQIEKLVKNTGIALNMAKNVGGDKIAVN